MEGRKGRPKNLDFQHPSYVSSGDLLHSSHRKRKLPNMRENEAATSADTKILRRLEAQGETVPLTN